MSFPAFRCAKCVNVTERCESCRRKRAASLAERRAAHAAAGQCTECTRTPSVDVTTGIAYPQCDAHRAANRRAAVKRGLRDVLPLVLVAVGLASSLAACAADNAAPLDQGWAGAPATTELAGAAGGAAVVPVVLEAPEPLAGAAGAPAEVAGSAAPSSPPVAGSPSPSPDPSASAGTGGSTPTPTAGAPAPTPVGAHATQCKLDVGGVVGCDHPNLVNYSTWRLDWQIDPAQPFRGANQTGCAAPNDPATLSQCVPGARCAFQDTAGDYLEEGTCI